MKMQKPIRVEITGRNSFWENAVKVEWEHQFPARQWIAQGKKNFLIDENWLEDLQRVAHQCFAQAVIAPEDVGKRQFFRKLFRNAEDET